MNATMTICKFFGVPTQFSSMNGQKDSSESSDTRFRATLERFDFHVSTLVSAKIAFMTCTGLMIANDSKSK